MTKETEQKVLPIFERLKFRTRLVEALPPNLKKLNHLPPSDKEWHQFVQVPSDLIHFKLDPGSHANILPSKIFEKLRNKPRIQPTQDRLEAYFGDVYKPLGKVSLHIIVGKQQHYFDFLIVDSKQEMPPVLNKESCEKLQLVKRLPVHAIKQLSKTGKINTPEDLQHYLMTLDNENKQFCRRKPRSFWWPRTIFQHSNTSHCFVISILFNP